MSPATDGSRFPPVYVTVDVTLLTIRDAQLQVMMIRRGASPWRGWLALPGGFVRQSEDLPDAAQRELREETGLTLELAHLEQLGTFGHPRRDPRARTVTVAYLAVLPSLPEPVAGTDASAADWWPVTAMLSRRLPFDHHDILAAGVARARSKLEYTTLATAFAGPSFSMAELRHVYEIVWGRTLDPGNFHRKVLGSRGFVLPTADTRTSSVGRPATLYTPGPAKDLYPPILQRDPSASSAASSAKGRPPRRAGLISS